MDEQAVDAFLADSGVGVLSMAAGDAGYGIPLSSATTGIGCISSSSAFEGRWSSNPAYLVGVGRR